MNAPNLFLSLILIGLLLLQGLPAIMFLYSGWSIRREEILAGFTDKAVKLYFDQFHPQYKYGPTVDVKDCFRKYYGDQFGRRFFVLPLLLMLGISAVFLLWSSFSVMDWLGSEGVPVGPEKTVPGHLPLLAVMSMAGAFMYCTYDQIEGWAKSDISPAGLFGLSFRLLVAVPTGYALASVCGAFGPPVAFLIGSFPTLTLLKIMRRVGSQKLGIQNIPYSGDTELLEIQGIDVRKSEMFAAENISTILQLAYADPVKLTIRTNLGYSYVVDCVSQALLWLYVTKDLPQFGRAGLRGAYEVKALYDDLSSSKKEWKEEAKQVLNKVAAEVKYSPECLENIWRMVALDPYTDFLYASWS